MGIPEPRPVSGHIWRRRGKRGAVWYAKYRLADGRQVQRRIGPAWLKQGLAPAGYFNKDDARASLARILAGSPTPTTFSGASESWLRNREVVRDCKPSTMRDYRNMVRVLSRSFGDRAIESISTSELEDWVGSYPGSNRTRQKYLVCLGSIFGHAARRGCLERTLSIRSSARAFGGRLGLMSLARPRSRDC